MYRRTFEVISKFISDKTGITVQFDTDGGAHADMKNDVLHLPSDIADKHAYSALALLMHEAAHIKHSKVIPIKEVISTQGEFHILNAIEDIRIDRRNFDILRNVRSFYYHLCDEVQKDINKKVPVEARALCWCIMKCEGFLNSWNIYGVDAKELGEKVQPYMEKGVRDIDSHDWKALKATILEIKKILGIKPEKDPPVDVNVQMGSGPCTPNGGGKEGEGSVLGAVEGMIRPGNVFAKGQGKGMEGGSMAETGAIAMDEMQSNQFKEILNMKEIKTVCDGMKLDTDSLIDFYTGDIEALFKEDKVVKKKRSKIMFLIDASGSMASPLIDGKSRGSAVSKSVSRLTQILDEVKEIEGVGIEWDIGMFRSDYIPMNKDNWQKEYSTGGGTNFERAFTTTMDAMLKDYSVDGKRIIIAFTDGDVADHEIIAVKESVQRNHSDVRCLIISVGCDPMSTISKEITGDNIIVAEGNATFVIMEAIKALL